MLQFWSQATPTGPNCQVWKHPKFEQTEKCLQTQQVFWGVKKTEMRLVFKSSLVFPSKLDCITNCRSPVYGGKGSEWSYLGIFGVVKSSASQFEVALFPPLEGARLFQQQSFLYAGLQGEKTQRFHGRPPSQNNTKLHSHMWNTFWESVNIKKCLLFCVCGGRVCVCVLCVWAVILNMGGEEQARRKRPVTQTHTHTNLSFL